VNNKKLGDVSYQLKKKKKYSKCFM